MNIYQIPNQYNELLSLLEECDDESLQEAVDNAMGDLKSDLKAHAESLGKALSNISGENIAIKSEIDRLGKLLSHKERNYESIKTGLKRAMIETETQKIQTDLYTFSLAKGRDSVHVIDESKLADEYVTVEVVTKPDKKKIKQGIDSGDIDKEVAKLVTGEKSLRIK